MASWAGGKSVSWSGLKAERRAWLRGRGETGRVIDWPTPAKIIFIRCSHSFAWAGLQLIEHGSCERTARASKQAKPRRELQLNSWCEKSFSKIMMWKEIPSKKRTKGKINEFPFSWRSNVKPNVIQLYFNSGFLNLNIKNNMHQCESSKHILWPIINHAS